ncbi:MAG: hypothetical protein LBJ08_07940 [Bifidobacteriaceae bacterium]|jgi:hypothetical protein|nr:hypothetical protein [Bifidobacteriaceae bacterium]
MSIKTRDGRTIDDTTLAEWADDAERGYSLDRLTSTDQRLTPADGTVAVAVRLPAGVYAALTARARDGHTTRDRLITEAVATMLAS